jgi:hypothetical protein
MQRTMLSLLVKRNDTSIRCRNLFPSSEACSNEEACKASLCAGYAVVYRNITNLGKKLENLGVGRITPPDNKRGIVEKGWTLHAFPGVRLASSKNVFASLLPVSAMRRPPDSAERTKKKKSASSCSLHERLFFELALRAFGSLFIAWEFFATDMSIIFALCASTAFLCFTLPFLLAKRLGLFLPFGISLTVLLLLSFSTVPLVGELGALFLALKNSIFMAILFLLVPSTHFDFQRFRKRSANIMFWLIWFYMAVLTAFDPSLLSTQELFLNSTFGELFSMLIDRFFLFFVLVFSVGFYSLGNKILEIEGDSICFNGRELSGTLSGHNRAILSAFIGNPGRVLRCSDILKLLSPGQLDECTIECKPSLCKEYQRIYKRIRTIRRYFETTGIGTIISPEWRPQAHEEGWRLVIRDDVWVRERS